MADKELAVIVPFSYHDPETVILISVSVSRFYSKLPINDREYYFVRETGEFDGTATTITRVGPILTYDAE